MDAIRAIVGVASVVVGTHALLFLLLAWLRDDRAAAVDCALLLAGVALMNGCVDALRHWFRHHG